MKLSQTALATKALCAKKYQPAPRTKPMAQIAITFSDQPDGKVDIQVYLDGIIEGAPPTPAQKLATAMLQAAKEDAQVADVEAKQK